MSSLETRLANMSEPHKPHCEYCGDPLPAKYRPDGSRIPKSGRFWNRHMQTCPERLAYQQEQQEAAERAATKAERSEHNRKVAKLLGAGFNAAQATILLEISNGIL